MFGSARSHSRFAPLPVLMLASVLLGGTTLTAPPARAEDLLSQAGQALASTASAVAAPVLSLLPAAANGPAPAADESDAPLDDRGFLELTVNMAGEAWTWVSYTMGSMFSSVTPPTPHAMVQNLQSDQQSEFFQFLGYSGYKLKEIENGVGLPPDITMSFGRIRELSEADIDFIEREIDRWARREKGVLAETQRAVINTLVSINQSSSYVVQSLKLRLLPLPQVKFTLGPVEGGLSEQDSVLLRAIQRLDRRVSTGQK